MPVDRRTGDFGARLRDARERRGVSLRQIADRTRISVRALEALEGNDISHLPGGIFSRSFVRAYALEVGLDPEETVDEFLNQFPHDSVTVGHGPSSESDERDSFESDRRAASTMLRLAMISIPIAGLLLYLGVPTKLDRAGSARQTAMARRTESSPSSASARARADRLIVEVVARRSALVTAAADGDAQVASRLQPGERRTFAAARELSLSIDDSDAVDWSVNGAAGRALGPAGQAASAHLTVDNFTTYLRAR